jgi:hypothetical protein
MGKQVKLRARFSQSVASEVLLFNLSERSAECLDPTVFTGFAQVPTAKARQRAGTARADLVETRVHFPQQPDLGV